MTNRNIIIGVIVILAIILIYNLLKKKPENKDDKQDSNQTNYIPSGGGGGSGPTVVTSQTGPIVTNSQIGKSAYSLGTAVPVFNNSSLTNVYKYAAKNEWIGIITGERSVGSSTQLLWWVVSGGKLVAKSSVYVK